jgi:CubicO group peptidase (beta-lactamase class C family)
MSSAEDMAHYLIAQLNGGCYGDVQILSPAGIDEMHRGAVEYRAMGMNVGKYGMGWFFSDDGQTKTIWHGGNVPDFSSFMALLPEQKTGIVLLVNADHYGLPPILAEIGLGATALLSGQQPAPIKLGFIPWAMRALLLIPLLQIIGVVATLKLLHDWRQDSQRRPRRTRVWGLHILLPLIPNLSLVALPIFLKVKGLFRYMLLYMPDVAWVALICGGFAGIWSILRVGLIFQALRRLSTH